MFEPIIHHGFYIYFAPTHTKSIHWLLTFFWILANSNTIEQFRNAEYWKCEWKLWSREKFAPQKSVHVFVLFKDLRPIVRLWENLTDDDWIFDRKYCGWIPVWKGMDRGLLKKHQLIEFNWEYSEFRSRYYLNLKNESISKIMNRKHMSRN